MDTPAPLPPVDVWATDKGTAWWFKPVSERAEAWMYANMGSLSDAQLHGDYFAVHTELVLSIIRQMVEADLHVKEIAH